MAVVVVAVFAVLVVRWVTAAVLDWVVLEDEVVFIGLSVLVFTWPETAKFVIGAMYARTHARTQTHTRTHTHARAHTRTRTHFSLS